MRELSRRQHQRLEEAYWNKYAIVKTYLDLPPRKKDRKKSDKVKAEKNK